VEKDIYCIGKFLAAKFQNNTSSATNASLTSTSCSVPSNHVSSLCTPLHLLTTLHVPQTLPNLSNMACKILCSSICSYFKLIISHSPTSRLLPRPRSLLHGHPAPNPRSLQKSRPKTPPRPRSLRLPRTHHPNQEISTNKRRILHSLRPHPSPRLRLRAQLSQFPRQYRA
jgi:hypothetical protein